MEKLLKEEFLLDFYKFILFDKNFSSVLIVDEDRFDFLKPLFERYITTSLFLPSLDVFPYIESLPPIDNVRERMKTIIFADKAKIVLSSVVGFLVRSISKNILGFKPILLKVGNQISFSILKKTIIDLGYEVVNRVEEYGTVSFKGSVIDIFPPNFDNPIRITLDFDEISSIKLFEPDTQVSFSKLEEIFIYPPFENDFSNLFRKDNESLSFFELFRDKKLISTFNLDDLEKDLVNFIENINSVYLSISDKALFLDPNEIIHKFPKDDIEIVDTKIDLLPLFSYDTNLPNYSLLTKYVESKISKGVVIFLSPNEIYTTKSERIFRKYNLKYLLQGKTNFESFLEKLRNKDFENGRVIVFEGFSLPRGFEFEGISVITVKELFNREFVEYEKVEVELSSEEIKEVFFFENVNEGDYVVHANYGVGIFRGIKEIEYFGKVKEFAAIEYEGGDIVYVPPEQFNLITKYIGSEKPQINSLKQKNWKSIKQKVRESILKFSRDLLRLRAVRQVKYREPLNVDFEEYEIFENSFPYEETPDQLKVMKEIKEDLASNEVMDRIVCGDVGFGKTEIAIRTAYLHILNGNQVMVLVPTTILAEQHFETFSKRFKDFGVRVGVISRLRTEKEINNTIEGISKGQIDILIGTHSLISDRVINAFKKLGLVIIDEEHKFGVEHKEGILRGREDIDVLTLSATPIPRTLGMGLGSLKKISLITTPPHGRKPVKTFIIEWNDEIIREAIFKEISRGGQVLVVNDKVKTIDSLRERIQKICEGFIKDDRIGTLHGQLPKSQIEDVFLDFISGKLQILISTTISESGLDLPNVNTVIINNSHLFGLADLHQIRGRVGRRDVEGFAYFVYPSRYIISEVQMKRLNTIEEHSDLGAGFRIAMKDLEIRGAGNLLGKEQHGNIKSVGYVFYIRMLSETLKLLSSEKEIIDYSDPVVYFNFDRIFPKDFSIPTSEKMEIMLKLNVAFTERQINYILEEVKDRYGTVPDGLMKLSEIVKFRIYLKKFFIEEVYETSEGVIIRFNPKYLPDPEKVISLLTGGKFYFEFVENKQNAIVLKVPEEDIIRKLDYIKSFIENIF
ncbi:MAG: DEAD/DEAH box helicase [Brevinematia bacterium]